MEDVRRRCPRKVFRTRRCLAEALRELLYKRTSSGYKKKNRSATHSSQRDKCQCKHTEEKKKITLTIHLQAKTQNTYDSSTHSIAFS